MKDSFREMDCMKSITIIVALTIVFGVSLPTHADHSESETFFVRRILPLLNEKCLACHGGKPDELQGGLDLRSLESLQHGSDSQTPLLIPGKPEESPLYLAVTRESRQWSPMPPKETEQLTREQREWVETWIRSGAAWPSQSRIAEIVKANQSVWEEEDGQVIETSGGQSADWTNRRYKAGSLWAYQPVKKPVLDKSGPDAIDALIDQRSPAGLVVAPQAEARVLIRRATFDLWGLPPQPNEVDAFEKAYQANPDEAMLALIDRLLSSPHYGERMAQHWLDVVRYADSSGFANDYERGNAWRYRDYCIRSFHRDKPYDDFVREQIAGDEIDPNNPEMIIATGFLRMGPWELTGMEVAKIARQRFLDDVTNSVGETFLAHSLQCARCHDHKFDPVPTQDYYAIQAVFATTQLCEREAPFLSIENLAGFEEKRFLDKTTVQHQQTLAEIDDLMLANAQDWFVQQNKNPEKWNQALDNLAANDGAKQRNPRRNFSDRFNATRNAMAKLGEPESDYPPKLCGLTPEQFGKERVARKGLERLKWELDRYEPFALSVYNGRTPQVTSVYAPTRILPNRLQQGELEETSVLAGGDPFSPAQRVKPNVLSVLARLQTKPPTEGIEGRRLDFAKWLAHPDNPLTTRTIVNRLWLWHFGTPIAGNPNNFGSTGKPPTHPELLDWLASEFVEKDWSIKALHRTIMMSQAYRRSSSHPNAQQLKERDPLGTSYAVFRPRRLSAEELRDATLAITGEWNPQIGGIPNRPEINLEAALQPRQVMGTFAAAWVPNPKPSERHRRSIYALKLRGLVDPSMEVFNAPAPDFSCERREVSTVTPQVFTLFNSRNAHARALALAARSLRESKSDSQAVTLCYQLCYGRSPTREDMRLTLLHWHKMLKTHDSLTLAETKPPLEVKRDAVEENTGENFTFSETLHANAEFVPDLQPSQCDAKTRAFADVCLVLLNTNEFVYVY
jgi:hypothetical protein